MRVYHKSSLSHLYKTPTYNSWAGAKARCNCKNNPKYPTYGARGITICPEWDTFEQFFTYMGLCPPGKSLDRIDNDKGYSPDNCRWATPSEQTLNQGVRRDNKVGVKGIYETKHGFNVRYKRKHYGTFKTMDEAVWARKQAEASND